MRIGYAQVEAVVRSVHGPGAKPTALLGRLKYLQRFDWPPGGAKGQGSRAGYGLEQLLGVMLAVELLELGLPPLRVVRLLRSSWGGALRALLLGWAAAFDGARPAFLVLVPRALEELGMVDDPDRATPDVLAPIRLAALDHWRDDFRTGSPAIYLIDPRRIVVSVRTELSELGLMSVKDVDAAFVDAGTTVFGVGEPLVWGLDTEA